MRHHATRLDDDVRLVAQRLFDMARNGDTQTLASYLDAWPLLDVSTSSGDTLVMLAAYHGHVTTLRMLLAQGACANTPNRHGQSPLGGAAFRGFIDVCQTLLDHGANPAHRDAAGHTPDEYAAAFGHLSLATLLREAQLAADTDAA